jgi:hypothetical protein
MPAPQLERDIREVTLDSSDNISLIDGREAPFTYELRPYFSEGGLHWYRAYVEVEALIALSESDFSRKPTISDEEKQRLRGLLDPGHFDPKCAVELILLSMMQKQSKCIFGN